MELKVVSWNLDGWHTIHEGQLALLDSTGADIALLQEVTPASLQLLREAGWTGQSALELVADGHTERGGRSPRFACAVLARRQVTLGPAMLVKDAPSPVRACAAEAHLEGFRFLAVSAALPPGSMWGRAAKVGQADALTRAVQAAELPAVIGMDRNGPRTEAWEASETRWWPEDSPGVFVADAEHGCRDVLDVWFQDNPAPADAARRARPDGSREVSYVEKRATPPFPRRYDVILVSDAFYPTRVRYRYDESIEAGSDHGLVEATLVVA